MNTDHIHTTKDRSSFLETFELLSSEITDSKTTDKHQCIMLDNSSIKKFIVDNLFQWQ